MNNGDAVELTKVYYNSLDAGEYDQLATVLDPEFTHVRPDQTLSGRDVFRKFMETERPVVDTEHVIEAVYQEGPGVAIRGQLLDANGDRLFEFVDVFTITDGAITSLKTYTRSTQTS